MMNFRSKRNTDPIPAILNHKTCIWPIFLLRISLIYFLWIVLQNLLLNFYIKLC